MELGAKLQNDDYHSTSWLVKELQQNARTMKYGHLRQHLRDSGGNTASLLMRTACQVSGIERRLPGISPRIEFRV
jgi:ribosomal protein L19